MLLLVGIGLALLANAWVDMKHDRQNEIQYLASLEKDFLRTKENLEWTIQVTTESNKKTVGLLQILQRQDHDVSDEDLQSVLISATSIVEPSPVLGTYEDIINSGALKLIQNEALRLELAEFSSDWDDYESGVLEEGFDQWNQIQVPYLILNFDVTSVYLVNYRGSNYPLEKLPLDREKFWTREFQNILAIAAINDVDQIKSGEDLLDSIDKILGLIEHDLHER